MEAKIVEEFTTHYYKTFDVDRRMLISLYREDSKLSFEGSAYVGAQAIIEKYMSLAFKTCEHKINTVDWQPSPASGLLIFITGQLLPEGEVHPLKFSQVFHLMKVGEVMFLSNDMFRLN